MATWTSLVPSDCALRQLLEDGQKKFKSRNEKIGGGSCPQIRHAFVLPLDSGLVGTKVAGPFLPQFRLLARLADQLLPAQRQATEEGEEVNKISVGGCRENE